MITMERYDFITMVERIVLLPCLPILDNTVIKSTYYRFLTPFIARIKYLRNSKNRIAYRNRHPNRKSFESKSNRDEPSVINSSATERDDVMQPRPWQQSSKKKKNADDEKL